jgi:hypothetical protein
MADQPAASPESGDDRQAVVVPPSSRHYPASSVPVRSVHPHRGPCPAWIVWVGGIFPIRHFAHGLQAGFLRATFHWSDVLIVAAWGAAGLLLAARFFRWEPKR